MKTQFAAIFFLAEALLASPRVFGKELKDYNQGELKQAVQDVVDRLYTGYKEPFGTIMFTLGRSADNPWDGAGQSEKPPADDTESKPKGGSGVKTSRNYVDLLRKGSFGVKPSYVKLSSGQQCIVNGFKLCYELKSEGELDLSENKAKIAIMTYGQNIEGQFSNINGDPDADNTWSGRKFKNVNGCSGRVMVYFKKPLDEEHVEGGEFFFEGNPNIWVWIDSKGKDYVMNLDGLEMDQRKLIDGFKIETKLVGTAGMPENAVKRRVEEYQNAIKSKNTKYEETDEFKRYRLNKWERLTIYKTVSDDKVCADFLVKGDGDPNILVTIYSDGAESIKEVPDDDISEIEEDEKQDSTD